MESVIGHAPRDMEMSGARGANDVEIEMAETSDSMRLSPAHALPSEDPDPSEDSEGTLLDFGTSLVCCHGDIVMGPDRSLLTCSSLLIIIPMVIFFAMVAYAQPAIIAVGIVLTATSITCLIKTGTTDPGIVPKRPPPETLPKVFERTTPQGTKLKYCNTCHLWRPERASHCCECNNCVERFDHHCPWTGTCIGKRNYRYFVTFICTTAILALFVVAVCLASIIVSMEDKDGGSVSRFMDGAQKTHFAALVLFVYGLLILCCVGGLCCYHTKLIIENKTTHEDMKYYKESPYDKGRRSNFEEVFCHSSASQVAMLVKNKCMQRQCST